MQNDIRVTFAFSETDKGRALLRCRLSPSVDRLDHDLNCSQGVGPPTVFGPKDSVLVLASVVASSVPHPVQVRVRAGVVPPASFMKVRAVPLEEKTEISEYISSKCGPPHIARNSLCLWNSSFF